MRELPGMQLALLLLVQMVNSSTFVKGNARGRYFRFILLALL